METIKFLTGALIFGAFLAGMVVMMLAVIWMTGRRPDGKEDNDDNDEHAEVRNRNRKPTYKYALSCAALTGVKEGGLPRAAVKLASGTAKTLAAARDEALKLLLNKSGAQGFGHVYKCRYVFFPEETWEEGGRFLCSREVLGEDDEVLASTQWMANYGVVE